MGSKVGLGDIRGLLVDTDKRPVLRLLPDLDEVCRGYALAHLGGDGCSLDVIADQVWLLNAIDWLRGQDEISWSLYKTLDYSGLDRELHEFAVKVAEDFLVSYEKQGGQVLKESWELLGVKRRWIEGEISDKELKDSRDAYWAADWAALGAASWLAYRAAYWVADMAADLSASLAADLAADGAAEMAADGAAEMVVYTAADGAAVQKGQVRLLVEMLEDSVGIERGVERKSLESKVLSGK